jgi:hypothetical protein
MRPIRCRLGLRGLPSRAKGPHLICWTGHLPEDLLDRIRTGDELDGTLRAKSCGARQNHNHARRRESIRLRSLSVYRICRWHIITAHNFRHTTASDSGSERIDE